MSQLNTLNLKGSPRYRYTDTVKNFDFNTIPSKTNVKEINRKVYDKNQPQSNNSIFTRSALKTLKHLPLNINVQQS